MATDAIDRASAINRGIRLEYVTVAWNLLEGFISVIAWGNCRKRRPRRLWRGFMD
jgi:hypothetical protein